jgi:hypothetical protein
LHCNAGGQRGNKCKRDTVKIEYGCRERDGNSSFCDMPEPLKSGVDVKQPVFAPGATGWSRRGIDRKGGQCTISTCNRRSKPPCNGQRNPRQG